MERIAIVCYLLLIHVAVVGLAGAWALGYLKRPNPSHTLTWVTQSVSETDIKDADVGSIMPGWDKDTLFHYLLCNGKQMLELTEFKDGIAIFSFTDEARGHTWLFNRRPTIMGQPAPPVSMSRRELSKDGSTVTGKRIDTYMDQDGDGIMEVRLVPPTDPNERSVRYRLRADAWEPWPWPEKTGATSPGAGRP